tara:strand:- start:271 stop:489 length:219 start_codon:yes stop_codon:yes gene_type:complete
MITKTKQNVAETFRKDLNDFGKIWKGSHSSMAKHFCKTPQVVKGLMTGENSPSAKTVDKLVKIMNDFKILKK